MEGFALDGTATVISLKTATNVVPVARPFQRLGNCTLPCASTPCLYRNVKYGRPAAPGPDPVSVDATASLVSIAPMFRDARFPDAHFADAHFPLGGRSLVTSPTPTIHTQPLSNAKRQLTSAQPPI
jgi:hypothetical protein